MQGANVPTTAPCAAWLDGVPPCLLTTGVCLMEAVKILQGITLPERSFTCGEILLRAEKVFVADALDTAALMAMAEEEMYSLWFEDWQLCYNDAAVNLTKNPDGGGEAYTFSLK